MFFLYQTIIIIIILFSPLIIIFRILKKKEDPKRFKEKFCIRSEKRVYGNLIWFHGSSVGEFHSIVPLLYALEKNKSIHQILITSSTLSSAQIFKKFKFKKTIHQFFPIDTNYLSKKFLNYWKPNFVIFIESEIWPNMITNLKEKSIYHILLNARITEKSFKRWRFLGKFSKDLFKSFNYTYPQNEQTKGYLKHLSVKKIKKLGNLKFSEGVFNSNKLINSNLKSFLSNKRYWCAASTHEGEELIVAKVHLNLQKKLKNLVSIAIPRNIQRTQKIVNIFSQLGLKTHLHSTNKKIPKDTQVYIVDTYGETKTFFKICKTVFLGKSLTAQGGQNPLEPARYNCNIIHGPNISNFYEIYNLLGKNKISFKVNSENQLIKRINQLLKKDTRSKHMGSKINKIGEKILKKTLVELKRFI